MDSLKQRRKRGVILTHLGLNKLQEATTTAAIQEKVRHRYTLEALSERTGLASDTIIKVYTGETAVDKRTLSRCFKAFNLKLEPSDYFQFNPDRKTVGQQPNPMAIICQDWGEAPDVSSFYGRVEELSTLNHWIVEEHCRLIILLGMGGIGKTALSVRLAQQVQEEFEFLLWRSLSHETSLSELLAQLLSFFPLDRQQTLPKTVASQISLLIQYLRKYRCLLVLDGLESLFFPQANGSYSRFLQQVGEISHQSCLVLTSREKPKAIKHLEGESAPVRVLQLKGLPLEVIQGILTDKGTFGEPAADWNQLVEFYAGNPLILQLAATTIYHLFEGKVAEFLEQDTLVFGEIRHLLEEQLQNLSEEERRAIEQLAVNHQSLTFSDLQQQMSSLLSSSQLLEALELLKERSLIEQKAGRFSLQSMWQHYLSPR